MATLAATPGLSASRRDGALPLLRLHSPSLLRHRAWGDGAGGPQREPPTPFTRKGAGVMGHEQLGLGSAPEDSRPVEPARYRAFISYSHADERAARKLHRWLESYRLPGKTIGRVTARGEVPRKLTPIFRDRNELPASTSLGDEVAAALAGSDCLILLCSPAARASRWVNQEVALFRALHPDRPVLAALLSGEPEDSFPPELIAPGPDGLAREPIAADFRRSGDGARMARLKIVAGLTGLPLDLLVQRDAQRQTRRAIAIMIASFALALLFAGLLVLAVNARNDAERQRQQAESLIEFMLTDLRTRLQGVGRLDILVSVNERALAYYGEQGDLRQLPTLSLERRARVLHAMGEDDQRRGALDAALAKFREAQRVTGALLAEDPDDPTRIFTHAQSEFWIGYTDFLHRRHASAEQHFQAYLRLARQLVTIAPRDSAYLRELSYAEGNLCSLALARRTRPEAALTACAAALTAMRRVADATHGDRSVTLDLANRHSWMADAHKAAGDGARALYERRQQARILDGLVAADPKNASYRQDWILSRFMLATQLRELGQRDAALRRAREARSAIARLTTADPENSEWRGWRARIEKSFPETSMED